MPVRLPVRRVVAENPSIVSREEMKIDEGQIEANDLAFCIFPDFLANQPVSGGAANERGFIGNLDELMDRPSRCGHMKSIAQVGYSISHLILNIEIQKTNSANPNGIRAVGFCT